VEASTHLLQGRKDGNFGVQTRRHKSEVGGTECLGLRRRLQGTSRSRQILEQVIDFTCRIPRHQPNRRYLAGARTSSTGPGIGAPELRGFCLSNNNRKIQENVYPTFRIGDSSVGHVRMNAALAHPAGSGARPSGDCLIVSKRGVAESEIVHAAYSTPVQFHPVRFSTLPDHLP